MRVEDIIEGIHQHIDLQNLTDYLTNAVHQLLSSSSSLWLWDQNKKCFSLQSQKGESVQVDKTIGYDGAVMQWFGFNQANVLAWDKIRRCQLLKDTLLQELQNLGAHLCLALRSDGSEVIGLLNAGPKEDGASYAEEELGLLSEIATQAALAIEKIKIYTQMIEDRVFANLGKIAVQIAHDLNSPLSNIHVFLQLLAQDAGWKDTVRPELADKFFPIARKEMERVTAIIKNLLMYARPNRLKTQPIAVNQLMNETLEITSGQIKSGDIHIIRHYHPEDISIPGEREQLTRVFVNLIQNAIEAMEGETRKELIIRTELEEQMVKISIQDTGRGIPEGIKAGLFIPFVTSGKKNGLGLGLSIIERFVTLHGGSIEIKTGHDRGTTFIIRLPVEKRGAHRQLATSIEAFRIPQNEVLIAQDISVTGLRLSSPEYIPANQLLKLFINLPDNSPPIPVLGKVVWVREVFDRKGRPYDIGLEFIDIGWENQERIIRWVNSMEKANHLAMARDGK